MTSYSTDGEFAFLRSQKPFVFQTNFTRESLAIEVNQGLGGRHVVEVLQRVSEQRPLPKTIRVDNGPEFTSKILDQWAYLNGVELTSSVRASRLRTH